MTRTKLFSSLTAIVLVISMILGVSPTTAFAADTSPTTKEIVAELSKVETPYFGVDANDYDINSDERIDVFDLVLLKRMLLDGEHKEITVATVVKLQAWLLGKPNTWLGIRTQPTPWYDSPTIGMNNILKNLCSNDFRFIRSSEVVVVSHGVHYPAVVLYFIGTDEYTIENVFVYNFANDRSELEEVVCEGNGFIIGLKDNMYTLVANTQSVVAKDNEPQTEEVEPQTEEVDPQTEETTDQVRLPEEKELSPAYVKYDLTTPNLSTQEVRDIVWDLSTLLKADPYTFTITQKEYGTVQLLAETGLATMEIIVEEREEPIKDTPIFGNDEFYLYYSNVEGFGISIR